ncbi:hypothetical protein E2C01_102619 [Portunus trituberculatus]|uniref:Uncharacterized protein n=1 Tax=Portunus trituberculatus TaxID=210409 RepID=A0A5B7KD33_PORTR|nr:hypothetical protein [Portunus trituberculatus]
MNVTNQSGGGAAQISVSVCLAPAPAPSRRGAPTRQPPPRHAPRSGIDQPLRWSGTPRSHAASQSSLITFHVVGVSVGAPSGSFNPWPEALDGHTTPWHQGVISSSISMITLLSLTRFVQFLASKSVCVNFSHDTPVMDSTN